MAALELSADALLPEVCAFAENTAIWDKNEKETSESELDA